MNWGNKLLVTFIAFGIGISYLVSRAVNTNFELVNQDYYKDELKYQEVIDGTNRANALQSSVKLEQMNGSIYLRLPAEMKNKVVAGTVLFYCAYDEKKDKRFPLQINSELTQDFGAGNIPPGLYTVKISWSANGQSYYKEEKIIIR